MEGYESSSYGDRFADVYDDWYGDISDAAGTAALVDEASDGLVVELGSGTGRLLAPLVDRGREVVGLDSSSAMARRCTSALPGTPVVVADMESIPLRSGSAGCVFVAFNTLFNVASATGQAALAREVHRVLAPGGCFVVEAFVPTSGSGVDERVEVSRMEADRLTLRVSRTDFASQTVSGHFVDLVHGQPVTLRPWHLRYSSPDQLDLMAADAGLELDARYGDWDRRVFDDSSEGHVSVYRRR